MILIAGRNSKQGVSLNAGKMKPEYIEVTSIVEMNEEDMKKLNSFNCNFRVAWDPTNVK